jgi:hypothetical protein
LVVSVVGDVVGGREGVVEWSGGEVEAGVVVVFRAGAAQTGLTVDQGERVAFEDVQRVAEELVRIGSTGG